MCISKPKAPPPPKEEFRPPLIEDKAPDIELEEAGSKEANKKKVAKEGTKKLRTDLGMGSADSTGLSIPN